MSAEFAAKWKLLQESYLSTIGERIQQLYPLWQKGMETGQKEPVQELLRHVHSMAGSGATYGLQQLSVAAKELELYVGALLKENRPFNDAENQQITRQIEGMLQSTQQKAENVMPIGLRKSTGMLDELRGTRAMKVLVAEDDASNRAQLVLLLESLGHTVLQAADGEQALDLFERESPELVLMDIVMPKMDGYQAAAKIKACNGDVFIPIIFISAADDEQSLVSAIKAGGDDFLLKPYNRVVLQAKIFALQRIEKLNRELSRYKARTEEEVRLAHHVYESITNRNDQHIEGVSVWRQAAGLFSGDLVFYTRGVDGMVHVFVGDFTGHGMAAALGGLIAADVFHALLEKGATPHEVIVELNRKMSNLMPTGRYCACAILAFEPDSRELFVWNCGLPDILIKDEQGVRQLSSKNLPLGVLYSEEQFYEADEVSLGENACVIVYSDGVTESLDNAGKLYSDERLLSLVGQTHLQGEPLMQCIKDDVHQHISNGGQLLDDVTLLVIKP
ncbi:MAG: SpoIIE family protein phosphatase [Gammaproteobacteria bacterium]|nr:SpoIIE family protein phosphatase [Gammaproteobacteria bacterium]